MNDNFFVPQNVRINVYELIVTENCNLRCKYCFDDTYSDRESCNHDFSMSTTLIPEIIRFINRTRASDNFFISFFGGEPLVNLEFIESFIKYAESAKDCQSWAVRYIVFTNGLLLNNLFFKLIKKHNLIVSLSLDGVKEAHDLNRIGLRAEPSWEKIVANLPKLISIMGSVKARLTVNCVVRNNTVKYLRDSYLFLNDLSVNINLIFDYQHLTDGAIIKIIEILEELIIFRKLPPPTIFTNNILPGLTGNRRNSLCVSVLSNVTISPAGRLFFCHRFTPKMYDLFSDFNDYYGDIWTGWQNIKYFEKMKSRSTHGGFVRMNKSCQKCIAAAWCQGGCISAHWVASKKISGLNVQMCKLFRSLTILGKKHLISK